MMEKDEMITRCCYTDGVNCPITDRGRCSKCGHNPAVSASRAEQIKRDMNSGNYEYDFNARKVRRVRK